MAELYISKNKKLRLNNVLIQEIKLNSDIIDIDKQIEYMENYILTKGATCVGPLIQYTESFLNDEGELEIHISMMRQVNTYLNNVETPYKMKSVIRLNKCIYCRYIGEESKIKFGYDKIGVTAFEENIELTGNYYTIFVNRQDNILTADIFMERAD